MATPAPMRDPNETRRIMNALPPQPAIIIDGETGQFIAESAQPLTHPPATSGSTDVAVPPGGELLRPEPPLVYLPDTYGARLKDWFVEGEGILASLAAGWVGLAVYTGFNIYWWCLATVNSIIANAAVIITDSIITLLVVAGIIMLIGKGKVPRNFVDLKGCMKGATPGRIRLWLD